YKDSNHKPELVYAITTYKAMNGFRPIETILELFREIPINSLSKELSFLTEFQTPDGLQDFFSSVMELDSKRKSVVLSELIAAIQNQELSELARQAAEYIDQFNKYHPDDIGLLAPLMLNVVELKPGEAMFLYAETPHAYVQGTALEVMANSDNVLRAGLTAKHIDVSELVDNTSFYSIEPKDLKLTPELCGNTKKYPVPVDDFSFEIIELASREMSIEVDSAEIVFCVEGRVTIASCDEVETLNKGESLFVSYEARKYVLSGQGVIARTYN
ncbi:mannose-6-phosphate isomerase, class I, partial [Vibrio sp. M260118]|uniref:mannose-6-phosphate isomerase, class I n=1 Tax=Vibrio sp. M260118 TaxID=3020896 RepID=UPI002F408475